MRGPPRYRPPAVELTREDMLRDLHRYFKRVDIYRGIEFKRVDIYRGIEIWYAEARHPPGGDFRDAPYAWGPTIGEAVETLWRGTLWGGR